MPDDNQNTGNAGGVTQGNQAQTQTGKPNTAPAVPADPAPIDPRQTLNTEQKGVARDTLNTSQHNEQSPARRSLNIIQKGGK